MESKLDQTARYMFVLPLFFSFSLLRCSDERNHQKPWSRVNKTIWTRTWSFKLMNDWCNTLDLNFSFECCYCFFYVDVFIFLALSILFYRLHLFTFQAIWLKHPKAYTHMLNESTHTYPILYASIGFNMFYVENRFDIWSSIYIWFVKFLVIIVQFVECE